MSTDESTTHSRLPESLSGVRSLFDLHRDMLLDLAASRGLMADDGLSDVTKTIETIALLHVEEIRANADARLAMLHGEVTAISEELARRARLAEAQEKHHMTRRGLLGERSKAISKIRALQAQLVSKRNAAEEERLTIAVAEIKAEQADHIRRSLELDDVVQEDPTSNVNENAPRNSLIDELTRRREEIKTKEAQVFVREEKLRERLITKTVAGFLVWLGYATVIATGTVLAIIMGGTKALQFGALIDGWRVFVGSIAPTWPVWIRVLAAFLLIGGLLASVAAAVVGLDKLLRKLWKWGEEKARRTDMTARLSPRALTPNSHMQLIAVMPFVLVAGILLTILVATPDTTTGVNDSAFLSSLFPTVGYTFIGITIAFLATAIFVMYFIQVIEPRARGEGAVLRRSWEFTVPPLMLIAALTLTPILADINLSFWIAWAAFMLLSSLSLGSGLVYHGVFKDATKARERIARIDQKIGRLTGALDEDDPDSDSDKDQAILAMEVRELQKLLRLTRLNRLGIDVAHSQAGHVSGSKATPVMTGGWRSVGSTDVAPVLPSLPSGTVAIDYRPLDWLVAKDDIAKIEDATVECDAIDVELLRVNSCISENENFVAYTSIAALSSRRRLFEAMIAAMPHVRLESERHADIAKEIMRLQADTISRAATAAKPFVDGIRKDLAAKVPFVEPQPVAPDQNGGES